MEIEDSIILSIILLLVIGLFVAMFYNFGITGKASQIRNIDAQPCGSSCQYPNYCDTNLGCTHGSKVCNDGFVCDDGQYCDSDNLCWDY